MLWRREKEMEGCCPGERWKNKMESEGVKERGIEV